MAVSRQALVKLNPAFADEASFPDDKIAHWSKMAEAGQLVGRFSGSLSLAHALFVAHQMAIHAHVATGSKAEFAPKEKVRIHGKSRMANQRRHYMVYRSKTLPKEFNTPDVEHVQAGPWNSTQWGQQLHQMRNY